MDDQCSNASFDGITFKILENDFQSVEFFPLCRGACGNGFEAFHVLVKRANIFLLSNPEMDIQSCESFFIPYCQLISKSSTPYSPEILNLNSHRNENKTMIQGLRLWLKSKPAFSGHEPVPTQLGYVNIIQPSKHGWNSRKRSSLDDIVAAINRTITATSGTGRVITVECVPVKYEGKFTNPDHTVLKEMNVRDKKFVMVYRVFFLHGPATFEMIGLEEFWPTMICRPAGNKDALYENFPEVFSKLQVRKNKNR